MRSAFLSIWLATMLMRCVLAFGFHRLDDSRGEAQNIALTLARTGEFANPYRIPTGPTAHTGPIYPAINALLYRFLGDTLLADRLRQVLNMVFAATAYAMLLPLATRLGLGLRTGLIAGFAGALLPIYYWGELPGAFENGLAAPLLIAATWLIAPHIVEQAPIRPQKAWLLGAWNGFLILASPVLLFPLLVLACLAYWRASPTRGILLCSLAAVLAVLTPWTIRNAIEFHRLIPVRDDFGLELAVSNNADATPDLYANIRTPYAHQHHPFDGLKPALAVEAAGGEAAYSDRMLHEALTWIFTHPRRFAILAIERTVEFWAPVSRYRWHAAGMAFVTLLAFGGWSALWRTARPAAWVLIAVPLSYSLTFLAVEVCIRYTYPVYWSLLLPAAALVGAFSGRNSVRC